MGKNSLAPKCFFFIVWFPSSWGSTWPPANRHIWAPPPSKKRIGEGTRKELPPDVPEQVSNDWMGEEHIISMLIYCIRSQVGFRKEITFFRTRNKTKPKRSSFRSEPYMFCASMLWPLMHNWQWLELRYVYVFVHSSVFVHLGLATRVSSWSFWNVKCSKAAANPQTPWRQ